MLSKTILPKNVSNKEYLIRNRKIKHSMTWHMQAALLQSKSIRTYQTLKLGTDS